jgi:peroxiredoxin
MKRVVLIAFGLVAAVLSAVAGIWLHRELSPGSSGDGAERSLFAPDPLTTALLGQVRPDFSMRDLDGATHDVKEWDGKVLVINFWATWCPPCRKEIPAFIQLQEKYGEGGLQFVGIAIEGADSVKEFASKLGINYPLLAGEREGMEVSRSYGNDIGALPYTVIIRRDGKIAYVQRGEISIEEAEQVIRALI